MPANAETRLAAVADSFAVTLATALVGVTGIGLTGGLVGATDGVPVIAMVFTIRGVRTRLSATCIIGDAAGARAGRAGGIGIGIDAVTAAAGFTTSVGLDSAIWVALPMTLWRE